MLWHEAHKNNLRKGHKGHNMAMTAEAKKLRAAYMREWRAKNPGKQNEINNRCWERKAKALKEKQEAAEKAAEASA